MLKRLVQLYDYSVTSYVAVLLLGAVLVTLLPTNILEQCWWGGNCHQIKERSFILYGTAMPICARCSGTYLGFLMIRLFAGLRTDDFTHFLKQHCRSLTSLVVWLVLLGCGIMEWFLEYRYLVDVGNLVRLLAGVIGGVGGGAIFHGHLLLGVGRLMSRLT